MPETALAPAFGGTVLTAPADQDTYMLQAKPNDSGTAVAGVIPSDITITISSANTQTHARRFAVNYNTTPAGAQATAGEPSAFFSINNFISSNIAAVRSNTPVSMTVSTVVLDAGASGSDDAYNGYAIKVFNEAEEIVVGRITDYVGATQTATISPAFASTISMTNASYSIYQDYMRAEIGVIDRNGNARSGLSAPVHIAVDTECRLLLAPHKLGFFVDTVPVSQQAALTAAVVAAASFTHTAPSGDDFAIQNLTQTTPYGFVTRDEGNSVLKCVQNLLKRVEELETKLTNYGLLPGGA